MSVADDLGINCVEAILFDNVTLSRVMGDIADFGFKHVRCEFPWQAVEPVKGRFDWSRIDAVMAAAHANDLVVLPVLGIHNPTWTWTPAEFATYAGMLAARIGVPAYELGNEPNLHHFNAWAKVEGPTMLMRAGAIAIRGAQPDARILSPGLAASVTFTQYTFPGFWFIPPMGPPIYTNKSARDWLVESMRIDKSFDVVAYHPYSIDSGFVGVSPSRSPMLLPATDSIRAALRAAEKPDADLMLTEWGFDSAAMSSTELLKRFVAQWAMMPRMQGPNGRSYLFCWRDFNGHGGKYGLVDPAHTPRQPIHGHVRELLRS